MMTTTEQTQSQSKTSTWQLAFSLETLVYFLLFLAAVALRWIALGTTPLNTDEATQAMAAWSLITPEVEPAGVIESPLTFAGAVISFAIFWASNASARFLPMLGGVALAFSPVLFRERLGRLPTMIAVGLLTLSTTALQTSRQMTGIGLSMLCIVLMIYAFSTIQRRGSILAAGAALGAALLADFGTPMVLVSIAAGAGFALLTDEEDRFSGEQIKESLNNLPWNMLVIGLVGALIGLGTLFFLAPNGLGAAANQITRLLGGFANRPAYAAYVGLVISFYEPGILVFGLVGAWQASQSAEPWQRFLAGWGIAALLVSLVYPGALPGHSLWAVVPLAGLAALAIADLLEMQVEGPTWGIWSCAGAIVVLIIMVGINLIRFLHSPTTLSFPAEVATTPAWLEKVQIDLFLASLWMILILITWLTASSLWGPQTATKGAGLGLLVLVVSLAIGQDGALAFTRPASPYEILNVSPAQPALDILVETAREIGELAVGYPYEASVTVQATPDSELAWALRDFNDLTFVERVDPTVDTVMVITPAANVDPALGSSYVGQDFVITRRWKPANLPFFEYLRWIFYRAPNTPTEEERMVLWVREDVYRLVSTKAQ